MRLIPFFMALLISFSSNVYSTELRAAIGVGSRYGGAFGWQGSVVEGRHRGSVGVGLFGASIGYDFKLNENVSAGTAVFATTIGFVGWSAGTLRLNYYLDETFKTGWVYGLEIFRTIGVSKVFGSSDADNFTGGFFSLGFGYK